MSKNKIIGKAVAEKTGKCWHEGTGNNPKDGEYVGWAWYCRKCDSKLVDNPNYTKDRNAIVEAVIVLCDTDALRDCFNAELQALIYDKVEERAWLEMYSVIKKQFNCYTASAEQLADALVEVIEDKE